MIIITKVSLLQVQRLTVLLCNFQALEKEWIQRNQAGRYRFKQEPRLPGGTKACLGWKECCISCSRKSHGDCNGVITSLHYSEAVHRHWQATAVCVWSDGRNGGGRLNLFCRMAVNLFTPHSLQCTHTPLASVCIHTHTYYTCTYSPPHVCSCHNQT